MNQLLLVALFAAAVSAEVMFVAKPICANLVVPRSGMACEEYQVTTEDGFELNVIHVPSVNGTGSPVVILQHGLLGSASCWFDQQQAQSLGYLLAKKGYDVWAPNSRGNWYSVTNKKWTAKQRQLWDHVDFDLMGKYDLTAVTNFVRSYTGASKVFYIGHSQGTTQAFAAFSKNYNDITSKIELFIGLAPVTQVKNCGNKALVDMAKKSYDQLMKLFGWASFPPVSMSALEVLQKLDLKCDSPDESLCQNILYDMEGATDSSVNITALKEDMGFDPAGTSLRNIEHWCQSIRNNGFKFYNYGLVGNLEHYGTTSNPSYHLKDINVKMALLSGARDELATPIDTQWTISQLKPEKIVFQKQYDLAHNDFIWSVNVHNTVYKDIFNLLEAHVSKEVRSTRNTRRN